jgi:murein DD-endopeptidase MepM/ murein hydrolase activator NlpD
MEKGVYQKARKLHSTRPNPGPESGAFGPKTAVERRGDNHYNGRDAEVNEMSRVFPLLAVVFLFMGGISHADDRLSVTCFPNVARQGDVCLVSVSGPESLDSVYGEFVGQRFSMERGAQSGPYQGLLGIDMNIDSGTYDVKAFGRTGNQEALVGLFLLKVEKVDFATQELTLPPSMVDLDAQTLERVNREAKRLKSLLKGYRDERLWSGSFVRPVQGAVTTGFGLRRIINGQPRSPHTGVDLRAQEGTPVRACNRGIVALVADQFFSGKSVVLDHGWGMYSMYFHLSAAVVKEGDYVARGALLGRAGSTGRATGPHLHWGIRLNGARIDPLSLIELAGYLEE